MACFQGFFYYRHPWR